MPIIPLTEEQIRDGLHSPYKLGLPQFTYSVPGAGSFWETTQGNYELSFQQPTTDYSTLSAAQATNFEASIAAWDELIAPNFTEVADNGVSHGEVRAAFTSLGMPGSTAAYAFQGSNQTPTSIVGDVWINANNTAATFDYGTDDYQTLLHEMGHVLGLKHSFDPPGSPELHVPDPYETTRYTVMSYTEGSRLVTFNDQGGGSVGSLSQAITVATPMVLDIAAVQDLYGADPNTRSGDTVYTFDQNDTFLQSIYDAGGTDTLDLSAIARPNTVDMNAGAYSSVAVFSRADQSAYWQGVLGAGFASFFDTVLADADTYTWNDNLGIAFGTTIENVIGGSGIDTILGNEVGNLISLHLGGSDVASGAGGDDGFYFGAGLDFDDVVDGGAGTLDQVGLQGLDYGTSSELHEMGPDNLTNVEMLVLLPGSDTRFGDTSGNSYSYHLETHDANVAAGETLRISFNTLRLGEDVTIDGSAETNGQFLTFAGFGSETLTGGAGDDAFYFGTGRFGSGEVLNGGAGTMDQLGLQGDYAGANAVTFGAGQLAGIEMIVCLTAADARFNGNGAALYDYDLTMHEGNLANGALLEISANTLIAGESLAFDASAETDGGRYTVFSGDGDDTLVGGSGADTFHGAGGADTLTGGGGNDTFAYGAADHSTAASRDTILDFTAGDAIDLSAIDAIDGGGGNAFSFIGAAAFSNSAGQLRAEQQSGANWLVEGDTDGDNLADFALLVTVTGGHAMVGGDFVL